MLRKNDKIINLNGIRIKNKTGIITKKGPGIAHKFTAQQNKLFTFKDHKA